MEITYNLVKDIVNSKLVERTNDTPYEDLSEILFGEGNCFNESEVRKRMYGMKRLIEIIESENNNVDNRILCISDTHVPYHLPVETYVDYKGKVDTLVFNGDILDCHSLSSFGKKYRISFMDELIIARQYLMDIVSLIKPKKTIFIYGNHESRMGIYLSKQLREDVLQLMPDNPLDLIIDTGFTNYNKENKTKTFYEGIRNALDCEVVYNSTWWEKIGETIFCHPIAYSSPILKTAEKAMQHFNSKREYPEVIVMAHTHKLGQYYMGATCLIEQGTCSQIEKLDYMDGKLTYPQQKGFVYLCHDKDGKIINEMTKLVKL